MTSDPNILLSVINTGLRDEYSSLTDLCLSKGLQEESIVETLKGIGYEYSSELNRFIYKDK
ncbi:MAG: DUF4250 domain-containing protein [Clostridiales bacterium]|nr:DUF4250 domain-containing protein [Clostridiales bacterium]